MPQDSGSPPDRGHWLKVLGDLNYDPARGIAPHKPLLLLVLCDLAEEGKLSSPLLQRTGDLAFRFSSYYRVVAAPAVGGAVLSLPHACPTASNEYIDHIFALKLHRCLMRTCYALRHATFTVAPRISDSQEHGRPDPEGTRRYRRLLDSDHPSRRTRQAQAERAARRPRLAAHGSRAGLAPCQRHELPSCFKRRQTLFQAIFEQARALTTTDPMITAAQMSFCWHESIRRWAVLLLKAKKGGKSQLCAYKIAQALNDLERELGVTAADYEQFMELFEGAQATLPSKVFSPAIAIALAFREAIRMTSPEFGGQPGEVKICVTKDGQLAGFTTKFRNPAKSRRNKAKVEQPARKPVKTSALREK
jgi:hypothetical protein